MAKTLSNSGITTNDTIRAGHVTQSIDALTGTDAYDITISGSLTSTGNLINTGGYALFVRSSSIPNSVLNVRQEGSGSIAEFGGTEIADQEQIVFNLGGHITASGNVSSSATSTASFGTYIGDGSQLTGITGGGSGIFTQTGSFYATTNDLQVTGSLKAGSIEGSSILVPGKSKFGANIIDLDTSHYFQGIGGDINMFAVRDSNSSDVLIAAGSATGLDLTVTLGDVEDANNGTKIKIDDATETVQVSGSLDASGTIYCDNREAAFYRLSGNSMIFSNSSVNTSIRGTSILLQSSVTASGNVSSSAVSTASFGTYLGDGSQLTGINGGIFAQTGSVQATTNDLEITGSIYVSDTGYSYFGRPDKSNEFFIFPSNGTAFIGTNTPTTLTLTANLVNKLVINDATTGGGHITASAFIIPNQDNNKDLGSPTKRWANIYGTTISGSFIGDGSQLTNLQRPISNSVSTNVTASNLNSGYYFRTGGNITCSIQSNAIVSCDVGSEFEFFQTSSAGNLLFHTGSGVTLNSKNGSTKLSNQFSAATLKKIDTNEWDLIGDLS